VPTLDPWFAKAIVIIASIVMVVIRAPHGQRSRGVPVVKSRKGTLEVVLLTIAWLAFFLPLLWIVTPLFDFADYPLYLIPLAAGVVCLVVGLWLFHRAHADLGTNWSITLEVREDHRLVTDGVYRHLRHPMYLALLLYALGQAFVLPNGIAGPSYLVSFGLLFALRVGPEEALMRERFGSEYDAYMARTRRVLPGIW